MGIRQRFEQGKALLNQGADLLLLRLQVLSLDLTRQAENVFRLAIWLVLSGALLMVGLVGLLFGLNRVLTDVAALWVFFGIFFIVRILVYLTAQIRNVRSNILQGFSHTTTLLPIICRYFAEQYSNNQQAYKENAEKYPQSSHIRQHAVQAK